MNSQPAPQRSLFQRAAPLARRALGCVGACLALGLVFVLLHAPLLRWAGNRLDIGGAPPRRADIIYVFAGGENERPQQAAALFKQGRAPRVMTAGGLKTDKLVALGIHLTEAQVNAKVLERNGVPADRIIQFERSASTWDEANVLRDYMQKHKLRSAILVTSNFHTRRTRLAARAAFRGYHADLYYISAPHPITDLANWWKNEEDLITVSTEYLKYVFYFINYSLGLKRTHATKHPEAEAQSQVGNSATNSIQHNEK